MENNIYTRVTMDNGKEYIFDQHPEEVINRMVDSKTGNPYTGFVHLLDLSINPSHISSIEDLNINKESLPMNTKFYKAI